MQKTETRRSLRSKSGGIAVGIGLRTRHLTELSSGKIGVDWIEAITESFLGTGGRHLRVLDEIAARVPVVLHGVSLGVGNPGPLDRKYVGQVRDRARRCRAPMISDHLCWTGIPPYDTHQLLPMPYTEESFRYVARRVRTKVHHDLETARRSFSVQDDYG